MTRADAYIPDAFADAGVRRLRGAVGDSLNSIKSSEELKRNLPD